jgi:hypothetical protein
MEPLIRRATSAQLPIFPLWDSLHRSLVPGLALFCLLSTLAQSFPLAIPLEPKYGQLPLLFEPMPIGELQSSASYLCRGQGYALRISSGIVDIRLRSNPVCLQERRRGLTSSGPAGAECDEVLSPAWLRLRFLGANESAIGIPELRQDARVNDFRGDDPALWRNNVPTYARVRYHSIYPGIDAVYYGNQRHLEYDFVVAPGADPDQIRFRFEGAEDLALAENGDLVIVSGDRQLRLRRPVLYQETLTGRQPVAGAYALEPGCGLVARFEVGSYDATRALVIDPVLEYSTYLGGVGYDQGSGVAVDGLGHAYLTGETASIDFPVADALWPTNRGGFVGPTNPLGNEAFVAKFGPAGTNLIYATYIGGTGVDAGMGIAVDEAGHAYVAGLTASTNFPITPDALQTALRGVPYFGFHPYTAFVLKLSPAGDELLYSTYLGGSGDDLGLAIALDDLGAAYVTGNTRSRDFPVHEGSVAFRGESDVFVAKLSATGSTLLYSTLLGGAGPDFGQGITVDAERHAIVTGQTASIAFPVTNAVQSQFRGGGYDAFVSKLTPDGRSLVFSTYLGGSNADEAFGIASDALGNSYITGYTVSDDFPVTNAVFGVKSSGHDAFLVKLDAAGSMSWSTFLGGDSNEEGWAVAVDAMQRATVVGSTLSGTFPVTNALQSTRGGNRDLFITRFSPAGDALEFSTYLGGSNQDEARGVAVDRMGAIYVTGFTLSTDFPVASSTHPFQPTFGGGTGDAFLLKIQHEAPSLRIVYTATGALEISWPSSLDNYILESRSLVAGPQEWTAVTLAPVTVDEWQTVTLLDPVNTGFFRLRRLD